MKESAHKLIDQAKETLYRNLKEGYSERLGTKYKYICPAKDHYFHQWFWDSCFHAVVLSHLDIDLAKNEIYSLLYAQQKDGFIPHIIYWNQHKNGFSLSKLGQRLESKFSLSPSNSQLIQPPLIAQAVEAIYKKDRDINFLQRVVPKLTAYYLWLAKNRDPDNDGLISIIAPYESGLDQSPSYDSILGVSGKPQLIGALVGRTITLRNLMRNYNLKKIFEADYFIVKDVLVNSIYIKNLQILSKLLHEIDSEESSRSFYHKYIKSKEALVKKCYSKKDAFFYDLSGRDEKIARVKTIKGLFPIILDLPKSIIANVVKNHLLNSEEFFSVYPIPTVAMTEPSFSPSPLIVRNEPVIWRGPTWINTNWFLYNGLKKHGFDDEAEHIKNKSVQMIEKSGFREFFNPFSGEGYGAHNFSWSTLIVDMLLS